MFSILAFITALYDLYSVSKMHFNRDHLNNVVIDGDTDSENEVNEITALLIQTKVQLEQSSLSPSYEAPISMSRWNSPPPTPKTNPQLYEAMSNEPRQSTSTGITHRDPRRNTRHQSTNANGIFGSSIDDVYTEDQFTLFENEMARLYLTMETNHISGVGWVEQDLGGSGTMSLRQNDNLDHYQNERSIVPRYARIYAELDAVHATGPMMGYGSFVDHSELIPSTLPSLLKNIKYGNRDPVPEDPRGMSTATIYKPLQNAYPPERPTVIELPILKYETEPTVKPLSLPLDLNMQGKLVNQRDTISSNIESVALINQSLENLLRCNSALDGDFRPGYGDDFNSDASAYDTDITEEFDLIGHQYTRLAMEHAANGSSTSFLPLHARLDDVITSDQTSPSEEHQRSLKSKKSKKVKRSRSSSNNYDRSSRKRSKSRSHKPASNADADKSSDSHHRSHKKSSKSRSRSRSRSHHHRISSSESSSGSSKRAKTDKSAEVNEAMAAVLTGNSDGGPLVEQSVAVPETPMDIVDPNIPDQVEVDYSLREDNDENQWIIPPDENLAEVPTITTTDADQPIVEAMDESPPSEDATHENLDKSLRDLSSANSPMQSTAVDIRSTICHDTDTEPPTAETAQEMDFDDVSEAQQQQADNNVEPLSTDTPVVAENIANPPVIPDIGSEVKIESIANDLNRTRSDNEGELMISSADEDDAMNPLVYSEDEEERVGIPVLNAVPGSAPHAIAEQTKASDCPASPQPSSSTAEPSTTAAVPDAEEQVDVKPNINDIDASFLKEYYAAKEGATQRVNVRAAALQPIAFIDLDDDDDDDSAVPTASDNNPTIGNLEVKQELNEIMQNYFDSMEEASAHGGAPVDVPPPIDSAENELPMTPPTVNADSASVNEDVKPNVDAGLIEAGNETVQPQIKRGPTPPPTVFIDLDSSVDSDATEEFEDISNESFLN